MLSFFSVQVPAAVITSQLSVRCDEKSAPTRANEGPLSFSNDWAQGRVLLKTAGTHENGNFDTSSTHPNVAAHFASIPELFDMQVQMQLRQAVPAGYDVLLGGELRRPMQLGWGTKLVTQGVLGCVRLFNPAFHSSFGSPEHDEHPHIAFPFHRLPDILVISQDTPPSSQGAGVDGVGVGAGVVGSQPPPLSFGALRPCAELGHTVYTPETVPKDLVLQPGFTYTVCVMFCLDVFGTLMCAMLFVAWLCDFWFMFSCIIRPASGASSWTWRNGAPSKCPASRRRCSRISGANARSTCVHESIVLGPFI